MKSRLVKFLSLALLSALILGACELPNGTVKSVASTGKGYVKVSIPVVNPFVAQSTTVLSKAAGSKAFAFVDTVELDFVKGSEVTTYFLDHADYDPETNSLVGTISVLGGDYDKLWVSVFNNVVSTTTPVVSGEVSNFTVPVNGSVNLDVRMYPYDPVTLIDGIYSDSATYALNGEKWYRFEAPSNFAQVTLKSDTGDLDAYIFGPDALPLDQVTGTDPENSLLISTTPYAVYYVCVVGKDPNGSTGEVKFANMAGSVNITFQ